MSRLPHKNKGTHEELNPVSVEISYLPPRLTNSWHETSEVKVWTEKNEFVSIVCRDEAEEELTQGFATRS